MRIAQRLTSFGNGVELDTSNIIEEGENNERQEEDS